MGESGNHDNPYAIRRAEAICRGCHSAYLGPFSFQARTFYERCGDEVFGTLDDFPAGPQRFFMRKAFTQARNANSLILG